MSTESHVLKSLRSAQRLTEPFPIIFAQNVFPMKMYGQMLKYLDKKDDFEAQKFANREFAEDSVLPGTEFMLSREFMMEMLNLFPEDRDAAFGGKNILLARELRLIRDSQHYKIGPHTDASWKVLSLLFYLPRTADFIDYGTSVYTPIDPDFRCEGGPHYPFELFTEVGRAPYVPNSCLAFWKTDKSFHGVAPIPVPIRRDVLLFNIYRK
jgi:hypothetical protein